MSDTLLAALQRLRNQPTRCLPLYRPGHSKPTANADCDYIGFQNDAPELALIGPGYPRRRLGFPFMERHIVEVPLRAVLELLAANPDASDLLIEPDPVSLLG